jgi:hypothetical protein
MGAGEVIRPSDEHPDRTYVWGPMGCEGGVPWGVSTPIAPRVGGVVGMGGVGCVGVCGVCGGGEGEVIRIAPRPHLRECATREARGAMHMRECGMRCGMRCNKRGDAMGWDAVGCGGMGCDGMRCVMSVHLRPDARGRSQH